MFDASPAASKLNDFASIVAAVLSAVPNASVPVPFGSMVIFASFAEVVISIAFAAVISIPPALAVAAMASVPEPAEFRKSEAS